MGLKVYTHKDCLVAALIQSSYCAEMSQAIDSPAFKTYNLPVGVMTAADVASVYVAVQNGSTFDTIRIDNANWTVTGTQQIKIDPLPDGSAALHNRVIFIPVKAFNLCFTGAVGLNVSASRALWIKRDSTAYMYDYLAITSIDYYKTFTDVQQFGGITFLDGVGSGFTNLTSDYVGMTIEFDGQLVGTVIAVNSVNSLTVDSLFTGGGTSRAFLYHQGTLEFALDVNGMPGTWSRRLSLNIIDTDLATKLWVRDYKTVTQDLSVIPNYSFRILGTEFIV